MNKKELCLIIEKERMKAKMTQKALANKAKIAPTTYESLLNHNNPRANTLLAILDALNLSITITPLKQPETPHDVANVKVRYCSQTTCVYYSHTTCSLSYTKLDKDGKCQSKQLRTSTQ